MSKSRVAERSVAYALKTAVEPAFGASFDLLATAPQGVKGLRALILSLATRGKLVAQSSDDHPASSLLGVLHEEWNHRGEAASKRRIGSDIPPVDPLTAIPPGWQYVRLGCVLDMFNGRAFKPTDWRPHGMPIVRIQNLNNIHAPYNYCDPAGVQPQHTIYKDAFLISWSGTPGTSFGAFIWTGSTAALNQHIFKCEQVAPVYQPAFLRLAINSQLDVLISKAHGGVGLQHVTKGTLENLVLPLPSLAEQARIVARVEELMQLCDVLEAQGRLQDEQHARLVATLFDALAASASAEELAENWQRIATHFDLLLDRPEAVDALEQTLLQLAVRGLLVPQDPADEPATELLDHIHAGGRGLSKTLGLPDFEDDADCDVPRGWVHVRMGDVFDFLNGYAFKSDWFKPHGIRLVRNVNVAHGLLDWRDVACIDASREWEFERFALRKGDIVISLDRPIISTGLKYAVIKERDLPCLLLQRVARLSARAGTVIDEFVHLWLNSPPFVATIDPGRSNGVPHISTKQLSSIPFFVPPLAEQHRIVARVEQLRRLCADLRERLQQARATQSRLADALVAQAGCALRAQTNGAAKPHQLAPGK